MQDSNPIKSYYNKLAPEYDQDRFGNSYGRYLHHQEQQILTRWLSSNRPTLSMACGTGRLMEWATHGVDISESMIQQAKSNYPDKLFRVADAQQTAYPDASFRQIFALHLLMHLSVSHIKSILKEAYRICEKGGTLLVDFPSAQRRQLVGHQQKGWHGATAFSLDEFKNIALESGWLLKKSRGIALFPVHRLPESMRAVVLPLDSLIGQSPLKAYASYLMVKLEKQ